MLRRKYHIEDIPVFGYLGTRQFFLVKIEFYNFRKLIKHDRHFRAESVQNLATA